MHYISKNQFILGDVLTLSLRLVCKYSKYEAATAAKRILNLPTVFEESVRLHAQRVESWLETGSWSDSVKLRGAVPPFLLLTKFR